MKVFNLSCDLEHSFEGWFASADEYESQLARGMIECPVCGTKSIRKMPAAPRLNLSSSSAAPAEGPQNQADAGASQRDDATRRQIGLMWRKVARYIVENTDDVGGRFAEEARRMHYDEAPQRGIRGVASPEETAELADEGIEVFSFPLPKGPGGPLQ